MIHIGDRQSWHARAPSRRLDNQIVVIDRDGEELVLAVGGPLQWASSEPLPEGARIVDLVAAAGDDPVKAAHLWSTFLRYLQYSAGVSILERALMVLGVKGIKVRVAVSDPEVRKLIVAALDKARGFRLVSLNA